MPRCPNIDCHLLICDTFCSDICNRLSSNTTIFCPLCGVELQLQREPCKCSTCSHILPNKYYFKLEAISKED